MQIGQKCTVEKSSICSYFRLIVDPQVDRGDELKRAGGVGALQQEDPEVLGCPERGGGSPQVSKNLIDTIQKMKVASSELLHNYLA